MVTVFNKLYQVVILFQHSTSTYWRSFRALDSVFRVDKKRYFDFITWAFLSRNRFQCAAPSKMIPTIIRETLAEPLNWPRERTKVK